MIGEVIADYMSSLFGSDAEKAAAGAKIVAAEPCLHCLAWGCSRQSR